MTLQLVTFIYDFFVCQMLCNIDRIRPIQIKSNQIKLNFDDENQPSVSISEFPILKRGSKTLLSEEIDGKVQSYLKTLRASDGIVNSAIVRATARGLIIAMEKHYVV